MMTSQPSQIDSTIRFTPPRC